MENKVLVLKFLKYQNFFVYKNVIFELSAYGFGHSAFGFQLGAFSKNIAIVTKKH